MSRPRIGIDYVAAAAHPPGIGRYVRELVRALVRLEDCPELRLFDLSAAARAMEGAPLGLDVAPPRVWRLRLPVPKRVVAALGRIGLGADRLLGGVDLFHRALPGHPRVSRAPEVLPIPELPPAGSPADSALAEAARAAAGVVVFSQHYQEAVVGRYAVDPTRVHRVGVGAEHWARELVALPERQPVALVLGALRSSRRPLAVLAGFERWYAGGGRGRLVFVGHPGDAAEPFRAALQRSPARAGVTWLDATNEAELPSLVAAATCLVHLAVDEGSPVTPLEACAFGLGVVAERLPAFIEALGEAAHWLPREPSPESLAEGLEAAFAEADDENARSRRQGLAGRFTWAESARDHLTAWSCTLGSPLGES